MKHGIKIGTIYEKNYRTIQNQEKHFNFEKVSLSKQSHIRNSHTEKKNIYN